MKWFVARLRTIHLQDISGDVNGGVVIDVLEMKTGITSGCVEPGNELSGRLVAKVAQENFTHECGNMIRVADEFLVGHRQGADGRKLALISLATAQAIRMASGACIRI